MHLKHIYNDKDLVDASTTKDFLVVQKFKGLKQATTENSTFGLIPPEVLTH